MKPVKFILVNETGSEKAVRAIRGSGVSDLRHHIIVNSRGLSHGALIDKLVSLRRQYPNAKILGVGEIDGEGIRAQEGMNLVRRELSLFPTS